MARDEHNRPDDGPRWNAEFCPVRANDDWRHQQHNINITAPVVAVINSAVSRPSETVTFATLTTNANTTLKANNFTLNPEPEFVVELCAKRRHGSSEWHGSMGNSRGGSTMTLNGGTFLAGGARQFNGNPTSIQMGETRHSQEPRPATRPNEFNVLNVNSGATLSIVSDLAMGQFFNAPCTINQNGGTVQFVRIPPPDARRNRRLDIVNNNNANFAANVWNLNGGLLAMNKAKINLTAGSESSDQSVNIKPVMNFNGGTLKALSDQPTAMFDPVQLGVPGQGRNRRHQCSHHQLYRPDHSRSTLGSPLDGGITVVDSVGGGNLTFRSPIPIPVRRSRPRRYIKRWALPTPCRTPRR